MMLPLREKYQAKARRVTDRAGFKGARRQQSNCDQITYSGNAHE